MDKQICGLFVGIICVFQIQEIRTIEDQLDISYTYVGARGLVKELNNLSAIVVPDPITDLRLVCKAKCPVEWKLEKFRYAEFKNELRFDINFRTARYIDEVDYKDATKYTYMSEIHFTGIHKLLTGNYICSCTTKPNIRHAVYVYWEGRESILFLQSGDTLEISRSPDTPWVTLYCGVSRNNIPVYLFKERINFSGPKFYEPLFSNDSILADLDGFKLNLDTLPFPDGTYLCSTLKTITQNTTSLNYAIYKVDGKLHTPKPLFIVTELKATKVQSGNTTSFDTSTNTLICCSKRYQHEPVWSQVGFWCENAQKCNYLEHRLEKSVGHNARDNNDTCSSFTMGHDLFPVGEAATFRCTMDDLSSQGTMFFSLDSVTYFSRDVVPDPDEMVRILTANNNSTNFVGAQIQFNCSHSHYLFSDGLIWVGTLEDGNSFLLDRRADSEYYKLEKPYAPNNEWINVRFLKPQVKFISCLAPVWNSEEWWNSTRLLNLTESSKPTFDSAKNNKEILLESDDTEVTLQCQVSGVPLPKIRWLKDWTVIRNASTRNISRSEVSSDLKVVGKDTSAILGTYVCEASNSIGKDAINFNVRVKTTGLGLIIGITVGLLVLFTVLLVILLRKVITQRKALRHLTEAEINEFEKGNPEALSNWKNDINGCTHLLPYNSNYEIPPAELCIDNSRILGQGTFGIVVKGTVRKGLTDVIVAIKTIRPNEDVSNFKVLLSELKIMAFIGRHENIVCLVGASSRNIRKRELMIAIEFCENGSLFDYLRKNRKLFLNILNPDTRESYVENKNSYQNDPSAHEYANQMNHGYENEQRIISRFSTKDLVLWSIHIANGMEFLASKKVVHADLATRNVLLTGDLTAKIGDFGLSKHLFEYSTYTKKTMALLPWKWMAIESLRDMEFSVMSDVWAYGVLLWELFTLAEVPYPGTTWTSEFLDKLINGFRLPQPKYASPDINEVLLKCMRPEPFNRPSFTTVKEWQEKILQRISASTN